MAATVLSVRSIHSLKIIQAVRISRGKSKMDLLGPGSGLHMADGQPPDGDSKGDRAADPWTA